MSSSMVSPSRKQPLQVVHEGLGLHHLGGEVILTDCQAGLAAYSSRGNQLLKEKPTSGRSGAALQKRR